MENNSTNLPVTTRSDGLPNWTVAKLERAKKLLVAGFTPEQVGHQLSLSQSQVEELSQDIVPQDEGLAVQTHNEWRQEKAAQFEKKVIAVAERHLDQLQEAPIIAGELVTEFKQVADVGHKWLRSGESTKIVALVNIDFLSEVKPVRPGERREKTIDVDPAASPD